MQRIALRRFGNPKAQNGKSQPEKVGFFVKNDAPRVILLAFERLPNGTVTHLPGMPGLLAHDPFHEATGAPGHADAPDAKISRTPDAPCLI